MMQTHTPQLNRWATPGLVTLLLLVLSVPLILTGWLPLQIVGGAVLLLALVMPSLGKAWLPSAAPEDGKGEQTTDESPQAASPQRNDPPTTAPESSGDQDLDRSGLIPLLGVNLATLAGAPQMEYQISSKNARDFLSSVSKISFLPGMDLRDVLFNTAFNTAAAALQEDTMLRESELEARIRSEFQNLLGNEPSLASSIHPQATMFDPLTDPIIDTITRHYRQEWLRRHRSATRTAHAPRMEPHTVPQRDRKKRIMETHFSTVETDGPKRGNIRTLRDRGFGFIGGGSKEDSDQFFLHRDITAGLGEPPQQPGRRRDDHPRPEREDSRD